MENDQSKPKSTSGKSAWYSGLAWFFLFMLALLWSVDTSLIYLFSGLAGFFILMSVLSSSLLTRGRNSLENLFQQAKREEKAETETTKHEARQTEIKMPVSSASNSQKVIVAVAFAGFALFVIIMMIGFFPGNDSDDAEMYFNNGENYYRNNQFDSATINYRRAISLKPDHKEALMGYAKVLQATEQYDSSILMFDRVLQIYPEYPSALYEQARTRYYQKNYDASIAQAKLLLSIDSSFVDAFQLLGDNFYTQEQYDPALIWYQHAYSKGVKNRYLCHLMGYLYQRKGDTQLAIDRYNEALQYDSTVLDIYERLEGIVSEPERSWCQKKIAQLQSTTQQ